MNVVELNETTASLADVVAALNDQPIIITRDGRPLAAVVQLNWSDLESVLVSMNPQFQEILRRSRTRHDAEGGLSPDQVRERFGLKPRAKRKRAN